MNRRRRRRARIARTPIARTVPIDGGIDAQPGKVLGTHALNLEAGKSYTIVIVGKANGAKPRFETIVVEDTVPAQPAVTN